MTDTNGAARGNNPRSRAWIFTCNNYSDEDFERFAGYTKKRYLCVGKETAPSTGTRHLQGYVYFDNAVRRATLLADLPQSHWEIARGTPEQCIAYCSKDGDFFEWGVKPVTRSRVQGWLYILSLLEENELFDSMPDDVQKLFQQLSCDIAEFSLMIEGTDLSDILDDIEDFQNMDMDVECDSIDKKLKL